MYNIFFFVDTYHLVFAFYEKGIILRSVFCGTAMRQAVQLAGFFGGRLLGQSVKLAELYSRIYALDAVENCRITLPAADTEISATELPVLGTVSITEEA